MTSDCGQVFPYVPENCPSKGGPADHEPFLHRPAHTNLTARKGSCPFSPPFPGLAANSTMTCLSWVTTWRVLCLLRPGMLAVLFDRGLTERYVDHDETSTRRKLQVMKALEGSRSMHAPRFKAVTESRVEAIAATTLVPVQETFPGGKMRWVHLGAYPVSQVSCCCRIYFVDDDEQRRV
jgi:hypothetical protein